MTSVITTPATEITTAAETAPVVVAPTRTYSIVAFALAIGSIVFGQTVVLPIVAIVLGILGYRQEPTARAFSITAIALGAFALFGWVIFGAVGLAIAAPFALFAFI